LLTVSSLFFNEFVNGLFQRIWLMGVFNGLYGFYGFFYGLVNCLSTDYTDYTELFFIADMHKNP
jgi:hypothetical protein